MPPKFVAFAWFAAALCGCVQLQPSSGSNPFGGGPLRVLIVEETDQAQELPADQITLLRSTEWKAAVKSQGGQVRVIDQHNPPTSAGDVAWANALNRPRQSVPWLYAGKGRRGVSIPFPSRAEDLNRVLRSL